MPVPITEMSESLDPFTITFAANAKPNAPTVTVRAKTEAVLELRLQALENNGTLATIARTANAFAAQFNVGDILGAQVEVAELQSTPAPPVTVVNNHVVEQPQLPDPATDAAAFALNQQRQPQPQAPQPVEMPAWPAPAQQAAPSPFAQPAPGVVTGAVFHQDAQQPVSVQQPAAPQQGGLPGQTGVEPSGKPIGPWLPGLNAAAVFVTGTGRSGEWRAWADPRSIQVTQNIQARTPVADDPALVAGTASYWDWIR